MKDLKYKVRAVRLNDKTWEQLQKQKEKSNLSWNLFLLKLMSKKL